MSTMDLLYEGKAKKIYRTTQENQVRVEYLDQLTALNGKRKDQCTGKGALTNQITSEIFRALNQNEVVTHFIQTTSKTEQLVEKLEMIPLEVVVRNQAAGSFAKRFQVAEGMAFQKPILEFYYKNDALDDPFINEDHIAYFQIADQTELDMIRKLTFQINEVLRRYFVELDLILIDFKLEFGRNQNGEIVLGDEISPDTCRLKDRQTNASLDKDIYRKQTGDVLVAYQEIYNRILQKKELTHVSREN